MVCAANLLFVLVLVGMYGVSVVLGVIIVLIHSMIRFVDCVVYLWYNGMRQRIHK